MVKKNVSPNAVVARKHLDQAWRRVLEEKDADISNAEIERLVNSESVSIRFCLPTQLLGKFTDPNLDCLCLQKGDGKLDSQWDPRGFATKVLVPWVMENQHVLGTSTDPYVSKPLRKPRLEKNPGNVKQKEDWVLLYEVLNNVQKCNDSKYTLDNLLATLRSIRKKLAASTFEYAIPERISLNQTRELVEKYLAESSGGDRGLSVAAALFQTFGKFFSLYSLVRREVINASDQSTGLVADIECINAGNLCLAIEVKERNLTLTDVKGAVQKARKSSIQEFLFNAPKINSAEEGVIDEQFAKTWASGTNLYQLSIDELIKVGLTLTGESGRKDFIENVGHQLNQYNTQPKNRQRWKTLLEEI